MTAGVTDTDVTDDEAGDDDDMHMLILRLTHADLVRPHVALSGSGHRQTG